jgi:hypothetical protein
MLFFNKKYPTEAGHFLDKVLGVDGLYAFLCKGVTV